MPKMTRKGDSAQTEADVSNPLDSRSRTEVRKKWKGECFESHHGKS